MVLHDLLGSGIHEQLQKVQSTSSAEVLDESDASIKDSNIACWQTKCPVTAKQASLCSLLGTPFCSGRTNLVVLLKVVVCGMHNAVFCMQDYLCIGWRQRLELQLGLVRFAYLSCKSSFREYSRHNKPSSHNPQHENKVLSDGGLSAICLMH